MKVARVNTNLLDRFPETYSTLLDKFFNEGLNTKRNLTSFHPQVDALETEGFYQLEVALSGFAKENIKLDFEDGQLVISGERKFDTENQENKYHFLETNYGTFRRSFSLPDNILESGIGAQFENGLLTVRIPKDEKKALKRQIEVK